MADCGRAFSDTLPFKRVHPRFPDVLSGFYGDAHTALIYSFRHKFKNWKGKLYQPPKNKKTAQSCCNCQVRNH